MRLKRIISLVLLLLLIVNMQFTANATAYNFTINNNENKTVASTSSEDSTFMLSSTDITISGSTIVVGGTVEKVEFEATESTNGLTQVRAIWYDSTGNLYLAFVTNNGKIAESVLFIDDNNVVNEGVIAFENDDYKSLSIQYEGEERTILNVKKNNSHFCVVNFGQITLEGRQNKLNIDFSENGFDLIGDSALIVTVYYTVEFMTESGGTINGDTSPIIYSKKAFGTNLNVPTLQANEGYTFDSWYKNNERVSLNQSIMVTENAVYIARWLEDEIQTVEVKYTVEHWVAGDHKTADDVVVTKNVGINDAKELAVTAASLAPKTYEGYNFSAYDPADITADMVVPNNSVIKVYYVRNDSQTKELSYTIEYYKDGTLVDTDVDRETVWIGAPDILTVDEVDTDNNKYPGYIFDHTDPSPVPETIANGGVIKVYYVRDNSQTKELSYTIEYYKDGVLEETDTDTEIVWIGAPDTLTVDEVDTNPSKYPGYKYENTEPVLPATISDGGVVKVYYVIDDSQTKELSYTIEHWIRGESAARDTDNITQEVWINAPNEITVQTIAPKAYPGYKYENTEPVLPATIANGGVVKVYYVRDDSQTKELSYTIEYYKDGVLAETDTETERVWIGAPDILTVDDVDTNPSKYPGYKYENTEPVLPATIANGGVIKVYYVRDDSQTKELSYTIEYYKDGVLAETDVDTETVWINAPDTLTVDDVDTSNNRYAGYKFDHTDPSTVPTTIANGSTIKVFYIGDITQSKFTVITHATPEFGGTTKGDGTYNYGTQVTITATPNNGYYFVEWKQIINEVNTPKVLTSTKEITVSNQPTYTFTIENNVEFVAVFQAYTPSVEEPTTYEVKVIYKDINTDEDLRKPYVFYSRLGSVIEASNQVKIIEGYKFIDASVDKITVKSSSSLNVITLYYEKVIELNREDHFAYVVGYPEGDIRPLNTITREEVATIFYRLLTDESRNKALSYSNDFTDVQKNRWSNIAISTLYNTGIIKGYDDGTFKPEKPITRAEFAAIASRFDKLEESNKNLFADIKGHWASAYINSSAIKGWIKGYADKTFKPDKNITRAEAMTLINAVLDRIVEQENIHKDARQWPDVKKTDWYYDEVLEATNSHDYNIDNQQEKWLNLKPNKVWP